MIRFKQKARGSASKWAKKTAQNRLEIGFFNYWGGGRSNLPREFGLFSRKSLSAEQFLCTFFAKSTTFLFFSTTKERKSPTNEHGFPCIFFAGQFLTLHFFLAQTEKRGPVNHFNSMACVVFGLFSAPYILVCPPYLKFNRHAVG